ncbi:uncharacterized protein BO72DRAFT_281594 [Aspergillus fijiensis CBS 313.89]|uniref:Uncharacterized protein n=1 Tax=Aspergillus fijiensis CBS 313.89 TaxID=1448319 RepID=A0A8G1RX61_9EURO|nr:uncharacterized protein BO72DRAFT_281594 [Aspergillus fijiensis CBS 313.89]RAK80504.1 hypothetical protein BO72DRAFT_281594 [Aspergillus fijiensis CBS 313.89]
MLSEGRHCGGLLRLDASRSCFWVLLVWCCLGAGTETVLVCINAAAALPRALSSMHTVRFSRDMHVSYPNNSYPTEQGGVDTEVDLSV